MENKELYTVKEFADMLNVTTQTVYNYIWDDKLDAKTYQPERRKSEYRIPKSEIKKFKERSCKWKQKN